MSVPRLNGVQLVVFFYFRIPVVLFNNPMISKCLNTLFLLSPHLCLIIGFLFDLFVVLRNDSWMSKKTSTRTKQILVFYHYGSGGRELGSRKASVSPFLPHPSPPPSNSILTVTFIVAFLLTVM